MIMMTSVQAQTNRSRLFVLLVMTFTHVAKLASAAPRFHTPEMDRLDNGVVRIGVDLALGGAITELGSSRSDVNLVNSWDWGRQIQMSNYSGPVPYLVNDKRPAPHWNHLGWNPVQAGDDFGNRSRVIAHANDGKTLTVTCVPQQFPLDNVPSECTFQTWITLEGATVRVRCRLTNFRKDRTQYQARGQELPAVYVNGPYHHLMTYSGGTPFTNAPLTEVVKKGPGEGWGHWNATECWSALVNDAGWGLGVWHPRLTTYGGGFAGRAGQGGPKDDATGYMTPLAPAVLDHNIVYEYEYVLIVGTVDQIRQTVYLFERPPIRPEYHFRNDRQGWTFVNAVDTGWPIDGQLVVDLSRKDPQIMSPATFWLAENAPLMVLDAAVSRESQSVDLFFEPLGKGFTETNRVPIALVADGKYHQYTVRLHDHQGYRGPISRIRIDPGPGGYKNATFSIRSVKFIGK